MLAYHHARHIYPLGFPSGSSKAELYHYVTKQLGGVALGLLISFGIDSTRQSYSRKAIPLTLGLLLSN
jgi:hypothetical protein